MMLLSYTAASTPSGLLHNPLAIFCFDCLLPLHPHSTCMLSYKSSIHLPQLLLLYFVLLNLSITLHWVLLLLLLLLLLKINLSTPGVSGFLFLLKGTYLC